MHEKRSEGMDFKRVCQYRRWQRGSELRDCSASESEQPMLIQGKAATVRASRNAVTIETAVGPRPSTGTIVASTRAALTTSRSIGTVSR